VAFAVSLMTCAYAYVVTWHHLVAFEPATAWRHAAIDIGLFVVFGAHHSLLARDTVKTFVARLVPDRLIRSVYVWTASLLLIGVVTAWQPVGGQLYEATGWASLPFVLVQLLGVGLTIRSVRAIDVLELAGVRQPTTPSRLQTGGPYRLVRHPLYLAWLLMVFGTPAMTGDRLVFALISSSYLVLAHRWEERTLVRMFGHEYHAYQQRVRWRLIPFLY
jgi:protein-S-isoprenylcysteine O-methyltransferase Ste14